MNQERDILFCLKRHKKEAKKRNGRSCFSGMWLPEELEKQGWKKAAWGNGWSGERQESQLPLQGLGTGRATVDIWSLHITWKVEKEGRTNLIMLCEVTTA